MPAPDTNPADVTKPDVENFGPLFDAAWYLARNPDVAAEGLEPLAHYLEYGAAERRDPNPLFDTNWYLAHNPEAVGWRGDAASRARRDLARSEQDKMLASTSWRVTYPLRLVAAHLRGRLRQYLRHALKVAWWVAATPWGTKRRLQWLRQRNTAQPDTMVALPTATEPEAHAAPGRADLSPLAHYLLVGAAEGRDPHPLFDTDWYIARNPDVSEAGINPLAHFLAIGASQGRAPHPSFDVDWSLAEKVEPQVVLPDPSRASRRGPPLVSVVIPVFNKAQHLQDCLSSILTQSLENIEVICVEDGSMDESPAILEELANRDPRVLIVRNSANSGAGPSRNVGIHLARGRFIQFTDADDILPRDALQTLYELATTDRVRLARGSLEAIGVPDNLDSFNVYRETWICSERHNARFQNERDLWVPWWHFSYLIDLSFLREVRAFYPNLSDGEDPFFIATLLVEAETVSTTSHTTYLYRLPETPRRTRLMNSIDFVRSTAMVRRLYLDRCPQCWRHGYLPFLLGKRVFFNPDVMSKVEQNVIRLAMMRAGIEAYLAPPSPLETQIKNNFEYNQAWHELSLIYFSRYDLQKAFPLNSPDWHAQLLEWAGATVPAIDPASAQLKAFQATYKSMLEASNAEGVLDAPACNR